MRKNRTFYKLFVSYLIIFIVPVTVLGIVNYYKTLRIVQKNIEKDSMATLKQASSIIDSRAKEIDKLSHELSLDSRVENLLFTKTSDNSEPVTRLLDVINLLSRDKILSDFIDEIYIYSTNNDAVLSSSTSHSSQTFFTDMLKNKLMGHEAWLTYIKKPSFRKLPPNTIWKRVSIASNTMLYINNLPVLSESFGSLLIFINQQKYFDVLLDITKKVNGYFYVLDENSQVIISNDNENNYINLVENIDSNDAGTNYIETKKGKAMMISASSARNNWRYITVIPNETFYNEIKDVKESTIIAIFTCTVMALIVSLLVANKNYKNIKNLVNIIKGTYGATNNIGDDFNFISNIIKSSYDEITSNKELLNSQLPLIKQSFLSNVLRESENIDIETTDSSANLLQIDLNFALSTVLILKILDSDSISTENNEYEFYKFAMRTTIEKNAEKNGIGYVLEIDNDKLAVIYGIKESQCSSLQNEIFEYAEELKEQIINNFHIAVSIGIGNIYTSHKKLSCSYQEALEAVDYATFNNENIVLYKNINRNGKLFNFPVQKEVQLINYIKNCKKEQAIDFIESIYEENRVNKEITFEMMKLFLFDLYCTIVKSLGEMKITDNSIIIDSMKVLDEQRLRANDMSSVINSIRDTIERICDLLESQKKDTSLELKAKILEHIEGNFTDSQISLDTIASNFNITPQYLSKFFKENIGINYVEYISTKRIERAKEYLLDNLTVKDAAAKVGFENMGNFIKVFKKLVGSTPSEYKQKCRINISSL